MIQVWETWMTKRLIMLGTEPNTPKQQQYLHHSTQKELLHITHHFLKNKSKGINIYARQGCREFRRAPTCPSITLGS